MKRRHTKRDLTKIFKERGLRANRLLGQNFLVDHNVLEFICKAAGVAEGDVVFEIGAGTGLLTEHLARTGATVVAVEIDSNLFEIAHEYVGDLPNVSLLCCDVHGARRRINPDAEAALRGAGGGALKVVSNLPYCISTDLLVSLLEMERVVERMVLTVQKEFADRLLAAPGSRDYGPLTVLLGAHGRVERLRDLTPAVFWPVPKVGSSVVRFTRDAGKAAQIADYKRLKALAAALFSQRRKTAAAVLRHARLPGLAKKDVAAVLAAAGVDEKARADGLTVAEVVAVSNILNSEGGAPT